MIGLIQISGIIQMSIGEGIYTNFDKYFRYPAANFKFTHFALTGQSAGRFNMHFLSIR
jgi:hypothetical protein